VVNLTAIVEPKEIAAKHYLDSWRVTRQVPLYGRSVLDLGTGAGFPGLPVAMAEAETRVVLLDSVQKRTDFLSQAVAKLGVKNASVVRDRAEEHLARQNYDVAMRAAVQRENVRLLGRCATRTRTSDAKGPSGAARSRGRARGGAWASGSTRCGTSCRAMGDRAILVYRPGAQGR
jgi:16S rRNA (guanine(527)-N(7))-methyltransferase RsmG